MQNKGHSRINGVCVKKKEMYFLRSRKLLFGMRRVSGVIVFIPRVPVVGR